MKNRKSKLVYFLQFVPVWLVMTATRFIPLDKRGTMIGHLVSRLVVILPGIRRRAENNLKLVYPEMSAQRRREIIRGSGFNVGKTLTEVLNMDQFLANPPKVEASGEGLEQLKATLAEGRGAVITSAHYGQWEAMRGIVGDLGAKIGAVYRPNNNPFYEKRFFHAVTTAGGPLYAKGTDQVKDMVRYAAGGGVIAILSDQRFPKGELIPFMGHDAWTSPAPASIALRLQIPLFVIMCKRTDWGLEAKFEPAITPSDPITMMKDVHKILEDRIHKDPEQWYWFHKRWDRVPKG